MRIIEPQSVRVSSWLSKSGQTLWKGTSNPVTVDVPGDTASPATRFMGKKRPMDCRSEAARQFVTTYLAPSWDESLPHYGRESFASSIQRLTDDETLLLIVPLLDHLYKGSGTVRVRQDSGCPYLSDEQEQAFLKTMHQRLQKVKAEKSKEGRKTELIKRLCDLVWRKLDSSYSMLDNDYHSSSLKRWKGILQSLLGPEVTIPLSRDARV